MRETATSDLKRVVNYGPIKFPVSQRIKTDAGLLNQ